MNDTNTIILILSQFALTTAQKIQSIIPDADIYGLAHRVTGCDKNYEVFSQNLKEHYLAGNTIIALCSSAILIRSLAPILSEKYSSPAVLSVAEDGSYIVPLLGAARGADQLADLLAKGLQSQGLQSQAAITTSAPRRFAINLLMPPQDLRLVNKNHATEFIADLLNGSKVRLEGEEHPWLSDSALPICSHADHVIAIYSQESSPNFIEDSVFSEKKQLIYQKKSSFPKGRVSLIGLGPGAPIYRTFAAERALKAADDILAYHYYIDLAGPFSPHQTIYKSDNGEELKRAHQALMLALKGRHVALLSSGDSGIYAMASAFFSVWEANTDKIAEAIEVAIEPGISAAFSAASRFGAPLGHDFAVISLSDHLKPWSIIEKRLRLSSKADLALALYNPVSQLRKQQLKKAIAILREERNQTTWVALAQNVARNHEYLEVTTLQELQLDNITSRTMILIGSSKTRHFKKNGRSFLYTPRFYEET